MLIDEQVAELLRRCEGIVGHRLGQVRGNLRNSNTRSEFVWELIVLEEVARVGSVEYEPLEDGSPDIRLTLPNGRQIWIEVAFLYERFWKEERQSQVVTNWVRGKAKQAGIPLHKLSCYFNGDTSNPAGPVRILPMMQEKNQFLKAKEMTRFFAEIRSKPRCPTLLRHSKYSLEIRYDPDAPGPNLSGGGLVQEAPRDVKQHALYRVLGSKARQHEVAGPRIICVGSDQSPALLSLLTPSGPGVFDAARAAFRRNKSLSGAIVVSIEDKTSIFGPYRREANGTIYCNDLAREPLTEEDVSFIEKLNFNRWKYSFRLGKYEPEKKEGFRRLRGKLNMTTKGDRILLEVPTTNLMDSLAGKTSLLKDYSLGEKDPFFRFLNDGWQIVGCSFKDGNVEHGEAPSVVLELSEPPESVFWPSS